ncbi:SDR family NAD(P)-dependent oxidoreductase [Sphingopyxis sp.]|uniref:SDR family NAD(P)-dependent oxidoreductase n=1 Tax=Sphingopyxis sp. TaxID=1908224 RepID=UPI00260D75A0|nr:SDR family NAD(P)-dependent oxidoreductase [Sphingopyxis sp.]MCW0199351.1 SDR family oxidoreductase [Sphingopyxis sp.]
MGMFEGKVALVTGGASGIGVAAALRFAQEGAAVVIADLNEAGAETIADQVRAAGGRARAIRCNVSDAADNAAMVTAAKQDFGRLDAAFLNAGAYAQTVFEETDAATLDSMIAINLKGAWLGLQAVLPALERGGAAVVTASTSGMIGLNVAAAYSAAKHGVVGAVRSASQSFARRGLRVNAICPGPVATAILGVTDQAPLQPADALALPGADGLLLPQHIAELALFLASPRSGGINGQEIIADAGFLASYPPMPE